MLKIFVLEDDENRIRWFKEKYDHLHLDIAISFDEAKELLSNNEYHMLFLDHDLGGEVYVDVNEYNTGTSVAKYMTDNGLQKHSSILIHSLNPVGSGTMLSILRNRDYNVGVETFTRLKEIL